MRRIASLVGPAIFGVVVAFAILEGALTLLLDHYECDERLGWRFRADRSVWKLSRAGEFRNRIAFNSHGFRDRERAYDKAPGTYRILLLGDSFLAALQVPIEESLPVLLEARLNASGGGGQRYEVINTGIDGYGTAQQLLLLREVGWRYQPDLVISQALVNDIADNAEGAGGANHYIAARCGRPYFEPEAGGVAPVDEARPQFPSSGLDRWLRWSTIYSNFVALPVPSGSPGWFDQWDLYDRPSQPAVAEAWALTRGIVTALRDEVERQGIPFVVMLVPEVFQVDMPSPVTGERDPAIANKQRAHERWRGLLDSLGIATLDLLPPLQQQADTGERPYFEHDYHWNRLGHQVVSRASHDWLLQSCRRLQIPAGSCASHVVRQMDESE